MAVLQNLSCFPLLCKSLHKKDGVWLFWQANRGILSEVFPDLFGEIPSTSTITRAQRLIEGDVLGDAIKEIMGRQYTCVRVCRKIYDTEVLSLRDVLACDGQAMRATARLQPDGSRSGGKQITSIVSYETGMTLGQVIHNKKNQEKQSIIDPVFSTSYLNKASRHKA